MSQGLVLDTDVISYLMKGNERASFWGRLLIGRTPCISFMTVAELERGAAKRNWGTRRREVMERILHDLAIIHSSDSLAIRWGQIKAHADNIGRPVGHGDAWIAATALELGFPLLTNNRRHYEDIPHLQQLPTPS